MRLLRSFRDFSLGVKLNVTVVLTLVVLLGTLLLVVRSSMRRSTIQAGHRSVAQEAEIVQSRFAETEQLLLADVKLMASEPELVEAITNRDTAAINTVSLIGAAPFGFDDWDVVDTEGRRFVNLEFGDIGESEIDPDEGVLLSLALLGIETTGGAVEEERDEGQTLFLDAVVPVRDRSGAISGAVLGGRAIDDDFLSEINFGREGVDLTVIRDGEIVALTEGERGAVSASLLDEDLVSRALSGQTVIADDVVSDPDGRPHAQAYTPLTIGGEIVATIVVETDLSQRFAFQRQLTTSITILFAILAVVAVGALALFSRASISGPLGELQSVAERMAVGDYRQRIEVKSEDEIGRLSNAFNWMAGAVERREADLVLARSEAEEASRVKSEFLATMSHELRTPLNAIIGLSDMFVSGMAGDVTDRQMRYLERIAENGRRQLGLVNDLLDMTRIEAGRMEIVEDPFTVITLAEHLQTEWGPQAAEKGLTFNVSLTPALPPTLVGDVSRLQQIVDNLVGNALKFTDAGKIEVAFDRLDGAAWIITVSDTGRGISPEFQEIIFDEFRQADSSSTREHSGAGLGLAIVRRLAMLMGGQVNVRSKVGQGSTFTVQLPIKVPEAELA